MQRRHLYEYAVIRLNPRVERGECINVGVILYCRDLFFMKSIININEVRLVALFPSINIDIVRDNLKSFQDIVDGQNIPSPITSYDDTSRFRWLTARRSTMIQCGEIHSGLTSDAHATLERLFDELVGE